MVKPSLATMSLLTLGLVGAPIAACAASEPAAKSGAYYSKKTCETVKATGSRLGGVRRCRSKADMDAMKADSREVVERIQNMKQDFCAPPKPC